MGKVGDSGFGIITFVNGPLTKTDPGGRPATKDSLASPLAGSVAHRDWAIKDREFKENGKRPKLS